jgi:hypothetical protein
MLGMTSCGKPPGAPCCVAVASSPSSSPLDMIAWLADSSMAKSSSESFNDCREMALGVLDMSDAGSGECAPMRSGVRGTELVVWLDALFFILRTGDSLKLSDGFAALADELCDPDLEASLSGRFVLLLLPVRLLVVLFSRPKAASRVSAKLWTPYVLSRCFPVICVFEEEFRACCICSSLRRKKAVGTWLDAAAG